MSAGAATKTWCEGRESPLTFDQVSVHAIFHSLGDCIQRIGDLDRRTGSRAVEQMLAFLWAAHDTLDQLTKRHRDS